MVTYNVIHHLLLFTYSHSACTRRDTLIYFLAWSGGEHEAECLAGLAVLLWVFSWRLTACLQVWKVPKPPPRFCTWTWTWHHGEWSPTVFCKLTSFWPNVWGPYSAPDVRSKKQQQKTANVWNVLNLKGNSTSFTNECVHRSRWALLHMYEEFMRKMPPVMSLSGSVALWVTQVPSFEKQTTGLALQSKNKLSKLIQQNQWYHPLCSASVFLFKNLAPTLPTMQLCHWVASLEQWIRLHAASFGATKGFIGLLLFSHMQ